MLLDDLPQDVFDKVLRSGLDVVDVVRVMAVSRQMWRQAGSERVAKIVWGHFGIRDASETWSDLADRDPMDCDDIEREAEELERAARWRNLYAHLREKFGAGEAHWASARGLYTDGGCDENDGDNFAGNLFNPDRHDKFFCSATSAKTSTASGCSPWRTRPTRTTTPRGCGSAASTIWRCNLTAKVRTGCTSSSTTRTCRTWTTHQAGVLRRHERTTLFDFSNWPDQEVFPLLRPPPRARAAAAERRWASHVSTHEEEIVLDDDADSWTKHPDVRPIGVRDARDGDRVAGGERVRRG